MPRRLAGVSYHDPGATRPDSAVWTPAAGYRGFARTVRLGSGDELWERASAELLDWGVKTSSGFRVEPRDGTGSRVRAGAEYRLVAVVGPLRIREPVRVVAVVDGDDRRGFAYGTLPGHPVSGEEAFVVHRTPDGEVLFTLRSLTRPGRGMWWPFFPAALVAQRVYRRRYVRALRP